MSARRYRITAPPAPFEQRDRLDCFGGSCTLIVADSAQPAQAAAAVAAARRTLLDWHARFSRFAPDSELAGLNSSPRDQVRVSPMMLSLIEAARTAARDTGGLLDVTLGAEIQRAGYVTHFEGDGLPLDMALAQAPPRRRAAPKPRSAVTELSTDPEAGTVSRPPGTMIDLGGIAKGVFADRLARRLAGFDAYVVDCAGEIRWGGRAGLLREVGVVSPFDGEPLHAFARAQGAIATSGIGKRSWLDRDGRPSHHLLDPRTGQPAYTGLVQASALARTAAEAEALATAAVLSGPGAAPEWLRYGGVLVADDGATRCSGPPRPSRRRPTGWWLAGRSWAPPRARTATPAYRPAPRPARAH